VCGLTVMNRRFVLAALAVVLLAASAGCLGYVTGGGDVSNETLDAEPAEPYDWDSDRDAYIEIRTDATFTAVYNVSSEEELRFYRETGYGTEEPLDLEAFRYQYPDGTVVNGSEFRARGGEIEQTTDEIWVRFPEDARAADGNATGKVAIQGPNTPKRFILPVYVDGSYEVVLPPDRQATFPVFGNVAPRGGEVVSEGNRQHVRWDEVTGGTILVQFYLERDLYVFAVVVVVATGIGLGGALYYKRRLDELREERREMGLDVEVDDDSDDPPPGLR